MIEKIVTQHKFKCITFYEFLKVSLNNARQVKLERNVKFYNNLRFFTAFPRVMCIYI